MAIKATILFDKPQREIMSLIRQRLSQSSATSIVTGFATPGGVDAIGKPIKARPQSLATLVVGAATYPGFEAMDALLAAGVPSDRLHVHLGHTRSSGTVKNPFVRYHPMLHSKVYYMELPGGLACAFIGSHNVTSFALMGLNGEASVLLEGPASSSEFDQVREHIRIAKSQAVQYSPTMKEAFAWWTREFLDGITGGMEIPKDPGTTVRTILVFAVAAKGQRPAVGEHIYFEIPAGIEQIEHFKTETHLFLFDKLPQNPYEAIRQATGADASFTCTTLGAENKQGNRELVTNWRIDGMKPPLLKAVSTGTFRPNTASGMQQVRAEVKAVGTPALDYLFDRERVGWDPIFSNDVPPLCPSGADDHEGNRAMPGSSAIRKFGADLKEAWGDRGTGGWKLVTGLTPRTGASKEKDAAALKKAAPESGSFVLVSVRRRQRDQDQRVNGEQ